MLWIIALLALQWGLEPMSKGEIKIHANAKGLSRLPKRLRALFGDFELAANRPHCHSKQWFHKYKIFLTTKMERQFLPTLKDWVSLLSNG